MIIIEKIKHLARKLLYGPKADSDSYISYLRSLGVQIGEHCAIIAPTKTTIDITRPFLISIGNNVVITEDVSILTHGYDWSVLKGVYGDVLGSSGEVTIGSNVFIGIKSTILKGVHIGNNVIIGANSLVNKDIPDNVVAAGNPCRVIMTLDEYHEKRKAAQIKEAKELVLKYKERYGKAPNEEALREFFWLFSDDSCELPEVWSDVLKLCGNYEMSKSQLNKNQKRFNSMKEFISECYK